MVEKEAINDSGQVERHFVEQGAMVAEMNTSEDHYHREYPWIT